MLKKYLSATLSTIIILTSLVGCGLGNDSNVDSGKISVVVSTFPSYDFVRQIAGDNVEINLLLTPGMESHSFEPSAKDIIAIQNADLFIFNGGENDVWADKIIDSIEEPINSLKLIDCVDTVEEKIIEGMTEEDHDHDDHDHDHEEINVHEIDEHVWTSPKNAILISQIIAKELSKLDAENAETFEKNLTSYTEKLKALDITFRDIVDNAKRDTVVFADRFPFRYLADEYGIKYYAAFPGCSNDSEISAGTLAFLIDKVNDEKIPVVFYLEFSSETVANSISEYTGCKTALLHSCHNVTKKDLDSGVTYASLMEQNAQTLKEALN